jgi:hypothetical protein
VARTGTDPIGEQALNTRISTPNYATMGRGIFALLGLGLCSLAAAGTLSLGKPVVQNNQYTFPVNLQGNAEGVAALDFRLSYDPAVFSPVSANMGNSAVTAQKQVSSNVTEPGEFVVVMMGFNQNEVQPGTVVELVLEKIGEPASGQSELLIAEPTMATYEGVELDSNGQARVVNFGEEKTDDETPETPAPVDEETDTETPTEVENADGDLGSKPTGSFRVIVAEETENKKKVPGATEATDGSASAQVPGLPTDPTTSAPSTGSGPADLPPGKAPDVAAGGAAPMTATSEPRLISIDGGGVDGATGDSNGAVIPAGATPSDPASAPAGESGNRGMLFAILLLVAVALPVSAFVLLKMLR